MVVHQDIGMQPPAKDVHGPAQEGEKPVPIFVISDNRAAFIPTGSDMIEGTGEFQTQRAGHSCERIAWHSSKVKTLDLTPLSNSCRRTRVWTVHTAG